MPSASTLMKNQAQCCASFRTPSQVGAAAVGGGSSSWEGLGGQCWGQELLLGRPDTLQESYMDQVPTLPITRPSSYADYILEGALQNCGLTKSPRASVLGRWLELNVACPWRQDPTCIWGVGFLCYSIYNTPWPRQGEVLHVGLQQPA